MRYLMFVFLTLFALSSFAVKTKNCPENFGLYLNQFTVESEGSNAEVAFQIKDSVKHLRSLDDEIMPFEWSHKTTGQCHYIRKALYSDEVLASATLYTRDGKDSLRVYKYGNPLENKGMLIFYVDLHGYSKDAVSVSENLSIYAPWEYESWGDSMPVYERIGTARVSTDHFPLAPILIVCKDSDNNGKGRVYFSASKEFMTYYDEFDGKTYDGEVEDIQVSMMRNSVTVIGEIPLMNFEYEITAVIDLTNKEIHINRVDSDDGSEANFKYNCELLENKITN